VTFDLRLKLLEMTNSKPAVSVEELSAIPKIGLDEALDALIGKRLVTYSGGVMTISAKQRVMLAEQLIHSGVDAKRVSRFLGWQEFEDFAEHILSANGFSTRKHLVFKSSLGRREIDIFAWNDTFMLAVDCKHWLKGSSTGRMKTATKAQVERTIAMSRRPELLRRLKIPDPDGRSIIPVILALSELRDRLIDGVPIVSVSKLLSFIYGVSPIDRRVRRIPVDSSSQSRLA
jgi:hypothetical protein